ncbi:high mobility group nucleosome binding domain 1 [Columba livia]|uniref:High mobility group nucleosome binding domain 1 n=1 Tax=Columba livia TaxID=8932 RepID=A0A2I0MRQ7_COLLI|nr:high mobility group nucleosome binding domain 1 [Columba livia]
MYICDKVIFGSCRFIFFQKLCSSDAKVWNLLLYL